MEFRGRITDVFELPNGRVILQMTEIEGLPDVGMSLRWEGGQCEIRELGLNGTDGMAVSTRSCLTGHPVPPYGAVGVALTGARPQPGTWVTEVNAR